MMTTKGDPGDPGEVGLTGERGQTGERGATGDHGQAGQTGETGLTGQAGMNAQPPLSRIQTFALLAFVVAAFTVLALYMERGSDQDAARAKVACERSSENTATLNQLVDELIKNTQSSDQRTPAEKVERVAGYQAMKRPLLDC